jgi:two-component system LytT family response regulator
MIRALIADDEPLGRKAIDQLLTFHKDIQVIARCEDGISAIEKIEQLQPDLVFLDIQMPGLDGFEVINQLQLNPPPLIIFVTAYDSFALKAFQAHAVDYLLKPLKEEQFLKALQRARQLIQAKDNADYLMQLQKLLADVSQKTDFIRHLLVREKNKLLLVKLDSINIFKANNDYVEIIGTHEKYLIRETLKKLEQKLDPQYFVRINRSMILRKSMINKLQSISKGDYRILLSNNQSFKLSRKYRQKVFDSLKQ